MIPLIKNTFLNEQETKKALAEFIVRVDRLSMGIKCSEFEKAFAIKQGRKEAILFNSGGSANLALLQSLKNLGRVKQNDNVGFSAITWATNVMPIIQMGMIPVAIDCSVSTLNVMAQNLIDRVHEAKLSMLFVTNVLGFAGNLDILYNICNSFGIILIEDNCEALGTELKSGRTGNFGLASTFSFFVAHHISTIEGGMVCTDDDELAEMLRIVRANGWDRNLTFEQQMKWRYEFNVTSEFESKYIFYDLGYNLRPTEITGFLGLTQLLYLDEIVKLREKNYLEVEEVMKQNDDLIIIEHNHVKQLSPFAIPVICKTAKLREEYLFKFAMNFIETRPMIAGNIQKQPFYKKYVKELYSLPDTNFLHNNSFYCGNYPQLTKDDLQIIKNTLIKN
jgi:CDP-6-deoxy-D-xylo-4-hexulose-3-dehydrase